jgi:hypothetical protein
MSASAVGEHLPAMYALQMNVSSPIRRVLRWCRIRAFRTVHPPLSLVPNRERRGGTRPELEEKSPRRVAFDWATRRKPLAGRTPVAWNDAVSDSARKTPDANIGNLPGRARPSPCKVPFAVFRTVEFGEFAAHCVEPGRSFPLVGFEALDLCPCIC